MHYIESNISKEQIMEQKLKPNVPESMKRYNEQDENEKKDIFKERKELDFSIDEVEKMLKEKHYIFSEEYIDSLKQNTTSFYRRFNAEQKFVGRVIGIIDGSLKGIVKHYFMLDYMNNYKHVLVYALKDEETNHFYFYKQKIENIHKVYLSGKELFELYKENKDIILSINLVNSLEDYLNSSNLLYENPYNHHTYDIHQKDYHNVLRKLTNFYHEKINKIVTANTLSPAPYVKELDLQSIFFKDYLIPFFDVFTEDSYFNHHVIIFTNELLDEILNTKGQIPKFKKILPVANKETKSLLDNVLNIENDLGRFEPHQYMPVDSFNFSILKLFTNTERLNEFIKNIHSCNNNDNSSLMIYETEAEYNFYNEILPGFFNSRIKFENELIRKLKVFMDEIEVDMDTQTKALNKGLENLTCDCEKEDFYCECENDYLNENEVSGGNNYIKLENLLEDTFKSFLILKGSYDSQSEKIQQEIDSVLSEKYNNFDLIHDKLADLVIQLTTEKVTYNKNEKIVKDKIEKEMMTLFQVLDNYSLKRVGSNMHHCVASYENQILSNHTSIFVLMDNTEFVACLEIDNHNHSIKQVKGKYNRLISDKNHLSVIHQFIDENNLLVLTSDISYKRKEKAV